MEFLRETKENKGVYKNHRDEPYFTYVREGKKTIEGRLVKGLYAEVQAGDYIEIHNRNNDSDYFFVEVVGVEKYPSFLSLLMQVDYKKVLPNVGSLEEGVNIYRQFYPKEKERDCGVVALEVKVVDENDCL